MLIPGITAARLTEVFADIVSARNRNESFDDTLE